MNNIKKEKGITIVALIITVIVLLVLAVATIGAANEKNVIIKRAEDAMFISDYQLVKTDIELYKMNNQIENKGIKNEDLIGTIAKKVVVKDTARELAVIVDFNLMNSKPNYGKGGIKLLEDNDKNTIKEVETLYDLKDVYVIDLEDGVLYYIDGEYIYTLETEKIEIEENGIIINKYPIETINEQKYVNKERFITKWNVILGETEDSETYSTVVLPVHKNSIYDAIIYWGDGTSTVLQHNINKVKLTNIELQEKVTHIYKIEENENVEKTIEIEGIYTDFRMSSSTSIPTKLKLIQIEQWGNISATNINFANCMNLGGVIPKNVLMDLNCEAYFFAETKITGLEEGFSFSGGRFSDCFRYCYELKNIPNSFTIPEGVTNVNSMFNKCTSLESLPKNFNIPSTITNASYMFYNCSGLLEIPDSFKIPENATTVNHIFAGCSNLNKIPSDFTLNDKITSVAFIFGDCKSLSNIPDTFYIPAGTTSVSGLFQNCPIKSLPKGFKIPEGVTEMGNMFINSSIESLPENFEIPETVTNMNNAFRGCKYLKGAITIKANPASYGSCFSYGTSQKSGGTLTVNYSKNCTNIDEILKTGNDSYVVKGEQID